ncbi:MAG: hypothetical protein R3A13_09960 [Bdellovibrionota bacterium]
MCGIFGVIAKGDERPSEVVIKTAVVELLKLSQTRGSEAAGLAAVSNNKIEVFKEAVSPSKFLKAPKFRKVLKDALSVGIENPIVMIGHSRMVLTALSLVMKIISL